MNLSLFNSGKATCLRPQDARHNPLKNALTCFQLTGSDSSWERITVHNVV
jgi:hypothetical protein